MIRWLVKIVKHLSIVSHNYFVEDDVASVQY